MRIRLISLLLRTDSDAVGRVASAPAVCEILLLVSGGRKRPALRLMGTDCGCAEVRREFCPVPHGRGKPLPYSFIVFLIDNRSIVGYHLPVRG